MRHQHARLRFHATAILTTLAAFVVVGVAAAGLARSAADDLSVRVNLGPPHSFLAKTTTELTNQIDFDVVADSGAPQTVTMRFALPAGLRFGSDVPDSAEGCTNGAPVVCSGVLAGPGSGVWAWPVTADSRGTYSITATVEGERPDPEPANNTYTFAFEIKRASGSITVSAGAVKLTPAKPKAGAAVIATAVVRADGQPVRPSKVVCKATLAGKKLTGKGTRATGKGSCRYATPKSAKGKTLAGSMAITAKGKTITKRFAARLR